MSQSAQDLAPQTDCVSGPEPLRVLSPYLPGHVISPGLYAGRIAARVKIGYSLNLPQRVDSFKFEELIAIWPISIPRQQDETEHAYTYRVRDALRDLEAQIHEALASQRIPRRRRSNANDWFRFDDHVLTVLFDAGAIVARGRVAGRPLGARGGKPQWQVRRAVNRWTAALEQVLRATNRLSSG